MSQPEPDIGGHKGQENGGDDAVHGEEGSVQPAQRLRRTCPQENKALE